MSETPQAAAASVVRAAYEASSLDNLTATVVMFGWHSRSTINAAMECLRRERRKEAKAKAKELAEEEIDMFA